MGFTPAVPRGCPFTMENIPFGVISTTKTQQPRCATAIGDYALDLAKFFQQEDPQNVASLFEGADLVHILSKPTLNEFAALSQKLRTSVRKYIITSLERETVPKTCFIPLNDVQMHLPMQIGDFTDFFCSLEHGLNCARMTGGKLTPNFFHIPLAYNGRASSVLPSPHSIRRPKGAIRIPENDMPVHEASRKLDFELEMGYFVSKPIPYGSTLSIENAAEHIFGFVLLNDWSARDIQGFEMTPLGPFNSKSFGTSISPWIITMDALMPYSCTPKHDHTSLPYLSLPDRMASTFDIELSVTLIRNGKSNRICTSNLNYLYWTPLQQIAQHASAMCGLRTGDLMGTGTISGDGIDENGAKHELGCLFEASNDGKKALALDDGGQLAYLQDDDEIVLEAWCGNKSIGFGQCSGKVLPSV